MASSDAGSARRVARHRPGVRRADPAGHHRSLDALKAYALGVRSARKGDDIGAIPFLEHAVVPIRLSPRPAALSAIYGSLGEGAGAREPRPPGLRQPRQRHRARAALIEYQHHDAIGDERRAISILEMWKQLYPRDYRAPNALAVSFNRMGDYARAIQEAQEAERRNPQHPFPRSNLAYAYRGRPLRDARRTAERALAHELETLPLRRLSTSWR